VPAKAEAFPPQANLLSAGAEFAPFSGGVCR
jgi:hypothetical protein